MVLPLECSCAFTGLSRSSIVKISRNQPCPCGSGKKYKKCCLEKDDREHTSKSMNTLDSTASGLDTAVGATAPLPPYAAAKLFEESEPFVEMKRRQPARAALFWTPSRAAALETEELVTALRELGVDGSRDAIEMLDDWMQEGYRFMMDGRGAQACERWSTVWELVRSRLRAAMRTCDDASVVFDGSQVLFNWVQDFALELHNAAVDNARYADTGVQLCEDVLHHFPDETELFRLNFRADLGEFYYLAGRPQDGERVLLNLIRDYPDRAAGYARLSDILAYGARRHDTPRDPQRAEKLLEDALARPVTDASDCDLATRLDDLRNTNH